MFLHSLHVERVSEDGESHTVPLAQLDNFCMRNFTNDAVFDDTLPVADSTLQVGSLVPLDRLQTALEQWFRRKQYLTSGETLRISRLPTTDERAL